MNLKIINNDINHKNYDATLRQSYGTYFNSIGKKKTPCQGVVGHKTDWQAHLCSIRCGVVLFTKVFFSYQHSFAML